MCSTSVVENSKIKQFSIFRYESKLLVLYNGVKVLFILLHLMFLHRIFVKRDSNDKNHLLLIKDYEKRILKKKNVSKYIYTYTGRTPALNVPRADPSQESKGCDSGPKRRGGMRSIPAPPLTISLV